MRSEPESEPSVAAAIPAYNETDGIPGFVPEIDRALVRLIDESARGSTWGRASHSPIRWRLVRFWLAALRESRSFKARLDASGWTRPS